MIYEKEKKSIVLSEIPESTLQTFRLETVAGRDAIADQIENDIDEYSTQAFQDGPRAHLGASVIGHECEAYIWFHFRWMKIEKFQPRKLRLFNRGHLEEDRIIEWLRGIGFNVKQTDVDGKQIRIADVGNHFGGSTDGEIQVPERYKMPADTRLLVEFKTSGSKYFPTLKGSGVIKDKPRHYSQMSVYGYKLGLKYALYICVNKDDDDLDIEVIELDWELGKAELDKALKIITATVPPKRLSGDASFWKCKSCPMNGICHLNEPIERNCRSCQFAEPVENAEWKCNNFQQIIPKEYLTKGCDAWKELPR